MLRDARILVTGATGQVALPVALGLAADNDVIAVARFKDTRLRARLEAVAHVTQTHTGRAHRRSGEAHSGEHRRVVEHLGIADFARRGTAQDVRLGVHGAHGEVQVGLAQGRGRAKHED